ncbi:MAG TPA: aromatic ring-hydroxylating dioxygenase subunit alpha [Pyrinomonadaceae bacterium]
MATIKDLIDRYDPDAPLAQASTIPASWYTDDRLFELEKKTVFGNSWQAVARVDQLQQAGDFVTTDVAGEPLVIVRGQDENIRAFFNVCRHHAAAVMTEASGHAQQMRCPYHGWTYALDGQLKGTPDFSGVCDFDRTNHSLIPVDVSTWEQWVFVRIDAAEKTSLNDFLGADLREQFDALGIGALHWVERRQYTIDCNWKVFVDNYLDGGYHVPHLHKGLDSVLDYSNYTIENGERFCLQSSPLVQPGKDSPDLNMGDVRKGDRARYYWIYPNFMINRYEGLLDTNLVRPLAVDRTEVVFDFYFEDISESARPRNLASVEAGERIQQEDLDICVSVQRGLQSRAYEAGRLSVRREAGEHLFHRLLHADLTSPTASTSL